MAVWTPAEIPWTLIVAPLVAFRLRFQFEALSGKSRVAFLFAISPGGRQRVDLFGVSSRTLRMFAKDVMSAPRRLEPSGLRK